MSTKPSTPKVKTTPQKSNSENLNELYDLDQFFKDEPISVTLKLPGYVADIIKDLEAYAASVESGKEFERDKYLGNVLFAHLKRFPALANWKKAQNDFQVPQFKPNSVVPTNNK